MILCSCDLPGIPDFLMTLVREKVAKLCREVDPKKIILAATHTHTSHTLGEPKDIKYKNPIGSTREILKEFMKRIINSTNSILQPEK